jgi:hypothetical protein
MLVKKRTLPNADSDLAYGPAETKPDRPGKGWPLAPDIRPSPSVLTLEPWDDEDERAETNGLERQRVQGRVRRGQKPAGKDERKQLKEGDPKRLRCHDPIRKTAARQPRSFER